MASINMCDRCEAMGLAQAIGVLIYHTGPNTTTNKLELCPACIGELVAWVQTVPPREGHGAFREAWRPAAAIEGADGEWRAPVTPGKERDA